MRTVLFLSALTVAAACTFPDVDYADGGAGAGTGSGGGSSSASTTTSTSTSSSSSTSGMCLASLECATAAMNCADKAQTDHDTCVTPCNGSQQCITTCDKARQNALGVCAALCDSCTGCKPNNCKALVGL